MRSFETTRESDPHVRLYLSLHDGDSSRATTGTRRGYYRDSTSASAAIEVLGEA